MASEGGTRLCRGLPCLLSDESNQGERQIRCLSPWWGTLTNIDSGSGRSVKGKIGMRNCSSVRWWALANAADIPIISFCPQISPYQAEAGTSCILQRGALRFKEVVEELSWPTHRWWKWDSNTGGLTLESMLLATTMLYATVLIALSLTEGYTNIITHLSNKTNPSIFWITKVYGGGGGGPKNVLHYQLRNGFSITSGGVVFSPHVSVNLCA